MMSSYYSTLYLVFNLEYSTPHNVLSIALPLNVHHNIFGASMPPTWL